MPFLRRVVISVVGGTVLLIGIAMIVLPAPSIIVIPAGLAILALEYAWARHWLNKFRALMPGQKKSVAAFGTGSPRPPGAGHGEGCTLN